jgi:hypothetical protein
MGSLVFRAAGLARWRRVVSVDLRGHDESDKPHVPYLVAAYAHQPLFEAASELVTG